MRKVDVVYLYEHAARELDVACVVSAILEDEYGISVEIVQWPAGFPEVVTKIRPRLVLLPFCYYDQSYRMMLAYWRDAVFLNLSWEQLFYLGNRNAKTPRGEFSLKHVFHHAWSEDYAGFLVKAGVPRENVFVNGNPAYVLYDVPYRHFFSTREELAITHNLDPSLTWVFFPENYNWAFYSGAAIEGFIENGQSPDDIKIMKEYCEQSLKQALLWCSKEAYESPVEIILRPRPSTSMEKFLAFVDQVLAETPARLHIIQRESVREWILASDIVISSHSTSLIEAAVAGKHVSMIAPLPVPSQLHVGWHDFLPQVCTQNEFGQLLGKDAKTSSELEDWARSTMMGKGDAIGGLATCIVKLLHNEISPLPGLPQAVVKSWFKFIPPAWVWAFYRRLKLFLRFPLLGGFDSEYFTEYVASDKIRIRVRKWALLLASLDQ